MHIKTLTLLSYFFIPCLLSGQMTAVDLIDKSIAYHDPNNNWKSLKATLSFTVERPDKPNGKRKVFIDNKAKTFLFWAQHDDGLLHYAVKKNKAVAKWNGNTEIPHDVAKTYRIATDRATMYRDYYTYLYGMPMKLKDEGIIIDPEINQVEFYGRKYNCIRVTYESAVGDDIWYFYFDPNTHALKAYQFYHDEAKNDGEYILFEELKEIQHIKIPRIRKWYYNIDDKFLATDVLN